jgi:DinB superfamily
MMRGQLTMNGSGEMNDLRVMLLSLVDSAEASLRQVHEAQSNEPVLPGGWSRKQVLGHLIDSASNNHQRFVRAALQSSLEFPGYDQDGCVRVQVPEAADWPLLVGLWAAYNRYLAHIMAHLPASKLDTPCRVGTGGAVTLKFLATDYVRHLSHHLQQIGAAA